MWCLNRLPTFLARFSAFLIKIEFLLWKPNGSESNCRSFSQIMQSLFSLFFIPIQLNQKTNFGVKKRSERKMCNILFWWFHSEEKTLSTRRRSTFRLVLFNAANSRSTPPFDCEQSQQKSENENFSNFFFLSFHRHYHRIFFFFFF